MRNTALKGNGKAAKATVSQMTENISQNAGQKREARKNCQEHDSVINQEDLEKYRNELIKICRRGKDTMRKLLQMKLY